MAHRLCHVGFASCRRALCWRPVTSRIGPALVRGLEGLPKLLDSTFAVWQPWQPIAKPTSGGGVIETFCGLRMSVMTFAKCGRPCQGQHRKLFSPP